MTVIVPARPERPIVVEGQSSPDITVLNGRGLPPGGTTGQALIKSSASDFAATWGSVAGASAWGGITGTLGDQADLQAALDAKQATLVSATNIKTINGSNILGAGDLVVSGGGLSDGDKGDITVSGSGATWTIDAGAVTVSKMANLAASTILGRATAGTGVPEALTASQVRTILNVADGATANASDASLRDRATHTGTQLAATISDFAAAVAATAAVTANTAKVTNATHTGEVTGATALTIAADAVTNAKLANMATQTFKGRTTAGTGDPEDLTVAQAKALLNLTGTNSGDQTSIAGITGTKAQFDTAVTDGNFMFAGDAPTAHTHTASEVTDFSEAVDDRVAALVVAGTNMTVTYNDGAGTLTFDAAGGGAGTNLSYTAATRVIASDTGTDATLPLVTTGDAGLAPASGGGTTNFLRADGTWAAPSGGGGGAPQIMSWMV